MGRSAPNVEPVPSTRKHFQPRATEQLALWVTRHRHAKRIRLLLLVPAGRWAEDMEYLLRIFSEARIDAYVTADPEVAEFDTPRIRVQHVGVGAKVWLLLALRLILMRPAPTLFLAGEKRLREARFLSALWPMSDPVVLLTMDQLVSALRRLASASLQSYGNNGSTDDDPFNRPGTQPT